MDEGTDTGPIIIQAVVPVLDDDTADTLAARILKQEHRIYPRAIQLLAEGRLRVSGRRSRSCPQTAPWTRKPWPIRLSDTDLKEKYCYNRDQGLPALQICAICEINHDRAGL